MKSLKDRVSPEDAADIHARLCGVKPGDTREEAALKVISTLKAAGAPARTIRQAERMLAQARGEQP